MDRVSSLLSGVLSKCGLKDHAESALVVHRASEWMKMRSPALGQSVRIASFRDGVLFVHCSHSVAMQECRGVIGDLQSFLASECAFAKVKDVRLIRD